MVPMLQIQIAKFLATTKFCAIGDTLAVVGGYVVGIWTMCGKDQLDPSSFLHLLLPNKIRNMFHSTQQDSNPASFLFYETVALPTGSYFSPGTNFCYRGLFYQKSPPTRPPSLFLGPNTIDYSKQQRHCSEIKFA